MVEEKNESSAAAFERDTAHVETDIGTEAGSVPGQSNTDDSLPGIGWTPPAVAEQFTAVLAVLEVVRGPHWQTESSARSRLGEAFCPLFVRYVPYGAGSPSWLGELMMWLAALGVAREVLGPALKHEMDLIKQAKLKQQALAKERAGRGPQPVNGPGPSSVESTRTVTSEESFSSPENEAPVSPGFNFVS